ncbi:MAG: hypothetical protein ACI37S_02930 [Candidatus Gastranaerophilaceae bacterium]
MVDINNNVNGSVIINTSDYKIEKNTNNNQQENVNSIFSNTDANQNNITDFENLTLNHKRNAPPLNQNSFNALKNYLNNGHSAEETYNYLVDNLKTNKDNPEYVQKVVDNLLYHISYMYDTDISYKPVAETKEKTLETFLKNTNNDDVDGAICATMHGFMKDVLNDAGIPAVLLASKMYTDNKKDNFGGHATLLYKMGENKYVHSNYGETTVVEADNIKSAVKQLFKQSDELTGERGYILLLGNDGETYDEFIFQDEAAYGQDIEKSNHVKENAFLGDNVKDKSSLDFNVDYNSKADASNVEAKGTIAIPKKNVSIDIGMAYKNAGETELMLNSKSYGAMVDVNYKKDFGKDNNQSIKMNLDTKVSTIQGETEYNNYNTFVLKGGFDFGYENKFFENDTTTLTGGVKASVVGGGLPHSKIGLGDYRLSTEAGLAMENKLGSIGKLNTEISAGFIGDLNKLNYTYQNIGMTPGFKANVKTALTLKPSDNALGMIDAQGYYIKTNTVEHYGASAGIGGAYKVSDDFTAFGKINLDYNRKDINIGLFNETFDNDLNLNANIGAKLTDNTSVNFNFQEDLRKKDVFLGFNVKKEF